MVQKDICRRLKIVKGIDLKARKRNLDSELLMQLKSITSTETGSRLVLDALLVPLCSALDLQRGKHSRHFNFGDAIVKTEIFYNV
jgi:hypothetical protein